MKLIFCLSLVIGLTVGEARGTVAQTAQALPQQLVAVQEQLYASAFANFLTVAKGRLTNVDLSAVIRPAFDSRLSRNEWLELFSEALVQHLQNEKSTGEQDIESLRVWLEERFLSYHKNEGFARFAYLETYKPLSKKTSPLKKSERLKLAGSFPTPHTLDVTAYVNERFPLELQEYVRETRASLHLDDSDCDDAYWTQQRQGFTTAVRFMGKLDNPHSQYFFVIHPRTQRVRFVACNISGRDVRTRLAAILGPSFHQSGAVMNYHLGPAPLISLNKIGRAFKFDKKMRVVIGFQNTVWWFLRNQTPNWQRKSLTDGGTEVALFENAASGEQILSVANVYGDEMSKALETLYGLGLRRFVYLGTAGGLADELQLGDLLVPEEYILPNGKVLRIRNDAPRELTLPDPRRVWRSARQGWIATLIEETVARMVGMKTAEITALDIESRYFAEFFSKHPALEKTVIMTVSDQPLGHVTYNQQSNTRLIPMDSVNRTIAQLFTAPTNR